MVEIECCLLIGLLTGFTLNSNPVVAATLTLHASDCVYKAAEGSFFFKSVVSYA